MESGNANRYAVTSDDVRFITYKCDTEEERIEADCSLSVTYVGLQLLVIQGDPSDVYQTDGDFMFDWKLKQIVERCGVLL
jgi:hypothetical protein